MLLPSLTPTTLELPIFTCRVQGGFASPADDHLEGTVDLNELLVHHPAATFFLRVSGNSMIGVGIHEGDLLVVDRSIDAKDGSIVIAALNGQLTVKRLSYADGEVSLVPENPEFQPMPVLEFDELVIWGCVTNVIHAL
jgi:DNA polymerase V